MERRRNTAGVYSRGGAAPEEGDWALQRVFWQEVWPWSTSVACVMHWWPQGGGSGLGRGSSTARAARRPRSSPELGAWAPRVRQGLRDLAHRGQGARAVLTEVRNGRSCSGAVPTSRSGGGGGVEVADWSQGWCSGLWIFTVRLAVVLRRPNGGQGG